MKKLFLMVLLSDILFSACSIEKRVYRKGFYVEVKNDFVKKNSQKQIKVSASDYVPEIFNKVQKKQITEYKEIHSSGSNDPVSPALRFKTKKEFLLSKNKKITPENGSEIKNSVQQKYSSRASYTILNALMWLLAVFVAIFLLCLAIWLVLSGGWLIVIGLAVAALSAFLFFVLFILFIMRNGE
jgi:ABC-type multidrug transport system fused ATPase/permease subunit